MNFGSNGKMAENGSEYGQNGGNIEENRDFQMFFSNTVVEMLYKYLINHRCEES